MLQEFIAANRELIIERARQRVSERTAPKPSDVKLAHGIPIFLTQITDALGPVAPPDAQRLVVTVDSAEKINDSAALNGHDLLRNGLTVAEVVNGYGDVCQVVTELATERNAAISAEEFHTFNQCLDGAIAGAVTAYGKQREHDLGDVGTERLGVLAHELGNLLNTAKLSFSMIQKGKVGVGGSTGAMLVRSLSGLGALVDRSLAEVRLEAGAPKLQPISVVEFIQEVEVSAAMEAEGYGLHLAVHSVESDVTIDADWHLLASAVSNLLQNAFKFSRPHGHVALTTRITSDRVLIDISDECGGLPRGKAEEMFRPFTQGSSDRSGLGLGLSIALNAARANCGDIHVQDIPGKGCVFTVDLPRRPVPSAGAVSHVLPGADHGSSLASSESAPSKSHLQ